MNENSINAALNSALTNYRSIRVGRELLRDFSPVLQGTMRSLYFFSAVGEPILEVRLLTNISWRTPMLNTGLSNRASIGFWDLETNEVGSQKDISYKEAMSLLEVINHPPTARQTGPFWASGNSLWLPSTEEEEYIIFGDTIPGAFRTTTDSTRTPAMIRMCWSLLDH
jgi:hypothetical protein